MPLIATRELLTTATVPNNNTIVLGGLIVARNNQTKSGIPILGDIPYLGRLFSNVTDAVDRSELMGLIQPSIINNARALNDVQMDMDARYQVSPRAHEFADGPAVLPDVGEIPVGEKGGGSQPVATPEGESETILKPSLRPVHRR